MHPIPRTWAEWKHEASILDNQWRQFNATCHQLMMVTKNPVTTSSHSTLLCSTPPMGSSKLATEPQPMDLDQTKSKNPPQICYNCNKPGHIACNCLEPCVHQVHNTDPLSLETI